MENPTSAPSPDDPLEVKGASKLLRVLIADDSENDAILLLRTLRKGGYEPTFERVWSGPAMAEALRRQTWDLVISDYEMPGFGGLAALQVLKESGLDLPFILVSAVVSEETAVAAMKAGAHDYMMKRRLARLVPAIERELQEFQSRVARRAAEAALKHSEAQLRQTQKIEAVGRLAASVAHDFNNILTAISGHSELLLRQLPADDPRRRNAEQIEKCSYMATALTRQLLTFSRKQEIEPRVLQVNSVVVNIQKMLRRLIGADVEFRTALAPTLGHIKADPGQLEQVIMNLAVNARDAMPDGGHFTIATADVSLTQDDLNSFPDLRAGDYVELSVVDTGTGMTDEVKERLFEPFFTTKPSGKGTGLGLSTCFGIVKQNAGCIRVESQLGKGTTFKIYFPQVTAPLDPSRTDRIVSDVVGGTETLLLAEDEPMVRELAATVLREKGYTILEATNGKDGLRLIKQHQGRVDLVVTDLVMPAMGGKELADAVGSLDPNIKFLFTSGYNRDAIDLRGPGRTRHSFLQKPFLTSTLARKVREVLDANLTETSN
jgi:signal transduction histidine kinase